MDQVSVFDRMVSDIRTAPIPLPPLAIFELEGGEIIFSVGWISSLPADASDYRPATHLIAVADGIHAFDAPSGIGEIAVEAAGYLQDYVMEMAGRGWPELVTGASKGTILWPMLDHHHEAVWAGRDISVPFGSLSSRSIAPTA